MVINLAPPENFSGANDVISMPCASDARASLAVSTCFVNLAVLWTVIFASYDVDVLTCGTCFVPDMWHVLRALWFAFSSFGLLG